MFNTVFDLDGTVLTRWRPGDFSPRPAPWLNSLLALGEPVAICSNQGGIAWMLAGGRPGRQYPTWPEVEERVRAGMRLTGARWGLVALHHPGAVISPQSLQERGKEIGLSLALIGAFGTSVRVGICVREGIIIASWDPGWRKPAPGMLIVARSLVRGGGCVYVGDEDSDRQAAAAAGMDFIDVRIFTE